MAKSKPSKRKKLPKSLRKGSLPRSVGDVWSAGVGALAQARKTGGDSFETLVSLGATVTETGTEAARGALNQVEAAAARLVGSAFDAAEGAAGGVQEGVEAAVEAVLARVGVPGRAEVLALREQVEALQDKLSALHRSAAPAGVEPAAATPATTDTPSAAEPDGRDVYQVVGHERGWAVERVGAGRAASVHATKKEALHQARQTARDHAPSRLVVYKADGAVATETDYDA